MDKLEDNCKSKLLFRVWARMVLMEVVGKDCFGRYWGLKRQPLLLDWMQGVGERKEARITQFPPEQLEY